MPQPLWPLKSCAFVSSPNGFELLAIRRPNAARAIPSDASSTSFSSGERRLENSLDLSRKGRICLQQLAGMFDSQNVRAATRHSPVRCSTPTTCLTVPAMIAFKSKAVLFALTTAAALALLPASAQMSTEPCAWAEGVCEPPSEAAQPLAVAETFATYATITRPSRPASISAAIWGINLEGYTNVDSIAGYYANVFPPGMLAA